MTRLFGKCVGDVAFVFFFLDQDVFQHPSQAVFLERFCLADAYLVAGDGVFFAP